MLSMTCSWSELTGHPQLENIFTFESGSTNSKLQFLTQVSFLDILVKQEDHTLHTHLYVKPTDTHMYLVIFEHKCDQKHLQPHRE